MKRCSDRTPGDVPFTATRAVAIGCALVTLVVAGSSGPLYAADGHASLMVSAYVLPAARLQMTSDPPPVQISAADVAQGYTDAPRPLRLRVESNSRAGFALDVLTVTP
jgi:hypothetical protein